LAAGHNFQSIPQSPLGGCRWFILTFAHLVGKEASEDQERIKDRGFGDYYEEPDV
jgi:hypothetical protein